MDRYTEIFDAFAAEIRRSGARDIILFGPGLTGTLVYSAVRDNPDFHVDCFLCSNYDNSIKLIFYPQYDGVKIARLESVELDEERQTIVLCTHSSRYGEVIGEIRKRFKRIRIVPLLENQKLQERIDRLNSRQLRSDTDYRDIKLLVESQPKSGTTWLVFSLLSKLRVNLGATFQYPFTPLQHIAYPELYYMERPGSLLVFAHFFKPVSAGATAKYPSVYPIRYLYDCYFSWARSIHQVKFNNAGDFILTHTSPEWLKLKKHIPLNIKWLQSIKNRTYIRYEDWTPDPAVNIQKFRQLLPEIEPEFFDIRVQKNRSYFTGDYRAMMDSEVFHTIKENFQEAVDYFWPEKSGDIY